MNSTPLRSMEIPMRWREREGHVEVVFSVNDDPVSLGCSEAARGFPICTATIEFPSTGYEDILGWVQLVDASHRDDGFVIDYFEPLGPVPHPFALYGWNPRLFDAPHSDMDEDWDFVAHSFLCGLGGKLLERHEVRTILGFSWGFSKRGSEFECFAPEILEAAAWDGHLDYLVQAFPAWTFALGFHQHPLEP